MKVIISLSVLVAAASSYPTFYYPQQETQEIYPQYFDQGQQILVRVPRQTSTRQAKDRQVQRDQRDQQSAADTSYSPSPYSPDQTAAASSSYNKPFQVGRVKIQTYRGPSSGEGYHVFAP